MSKKIIVVIISIIVAVIIGGAITAFVVLKGEQGSKMTIIMK